MFEPESLEAKVQEKHARELESPDIYISIEKYQNQRS